MFNFYKGRRVDLNTEFLFSNDLKCDVNVMFSISEFKKLIEKLRGGKAYISQTSLALKLTERR